MSDDREAFEAHAKQQCLALGEDLALFERTVEIVVDLDRYDYTYLWSWLGLPIIQMPADVMATQEVIWATKPDIIVETGIARGGSMIFLASMLQLLGRGTVIGVDIDIRAHNRQAIESHPLAHRVKMIEGSSTADETLACVRGLIPPAAKVMVILDSNHSRQHVLDELRAYGPLGHAGPVSRGCRHPARPHSAGPNSQEAFNGLGTRQRTAGGLEAVHERNGPFRSRSRGQRQADHFKFTGRLHSLP